AEPDTGVRFVRTDLPDAPAIPAALDSLAPRPRRTVLRNGEAQVEMVEHLLAAVSAFGIDNLTAELDASELPIGDGSATLFAAMLAEAGVAEQDEPRRLLSLRKPITVTEGGGTLVALPANEGLAVSYTLDLDDIDMAAQHYEATISREVFVDEIAPARTFVREREAKKLLEQGFGRAATADLVVVIRDDGSILDSELRYPDEPARHKALDLLGDLRLAGPGLQARVLAVKSGHAANVRLVRRILREAAPPDALGLDIRDILSVVPHRYPFLLVDRVVHIEPGVRATAIKNVTVNEPFFQGHFPGRPMMPGVLMIECMAQASGLLLYQRCADANLIAQLVSVDGAKFRRPVVPGDQLGVEVEALRMGSRTCKVAARATVDDELAAQAVITFVLVETPPSD
ncbi:MAG: 3-hydroxyacyl-ACP dehydratase FabZ, partial [Planctomycetota bacterium]